AISSYRKSMGLFDEIATRSPENGQAQVGRMTVRRRLGDLYNDNRKAAEAAAVYRQALDLGAQAMARAPEDAAIRRELGESYLAFSILSREAGDYGMARDQATQGLRLMEPLASAHPEDRKLQVSMAGGYG